MLLLADCVTGDFLLARSSMSLARLRSLESVELMSAAIEHLVKVMYSTRGPKLLPM